MLLTDPLLPPAEWPGVRAAYRFAPPSADAPPSLVLSFVFDPARVTGGGAAPEDGDGAKQRAREALLRYATAAAQLADPGTALAVTQSVLPADGGTSEAGPLGARSSSTGATSSKASSLAIARPPLMVVGVFLVLHAATGSRRRG